MWFQTDAQGLAHDGAVGAQVLSGHEPAVGLHAAHQGRADRALVQAGGAVVAQALILLVREQRSHLVPGRPAQTIGL